MDTNGLHDMISSSPPPVPPEYANANIVFTSPIVDEDHNKVESDKKVAVTLQFLLDDDSDHIVITTWLLNKSGMVIAQLYEMIREIDNLEEVIQDYRSFAQRHIQECAELTYSWWKVDQLPLSWCKEVFRSLGPLSFVARDGQPEVFDMTEVNKIHASRKANQHTR